MIIKKVYLYKDLRDLLLKELGVESESVATTISWEVNPSDAHLSKLRFLVEDNNGITAEEIAEEFEDNKQDDCECPCDCC